MNTYPLPYDPTPYDDTQTGHSYAAGWSVLIGFTVLAGLIATASFQWAALNHFFGA